MQAGIASSCKLTLEFHKKFEQRAPCIQQGNAAIAANNAAATKATATTAAANISH